MDLLKSNQFLVVEDHLKQMNSWDDPWNKLQSVRKYFHGIREIFNSIHCVNSRELALASFTAVCILSLIRQPVSYIHSNLKYLDCYIKLNQNDDDYKLITILNVSIILHRYQQTIYTIAGNYKQFYEESHSFKNIMMLSSMSN
jgi:hypothetical protein